MFVLLKKVFCEKFIPNKNKYCYIYKYNDTQ